MAKLIWSEPALQDLDAIADYIALDDASAAARLVERIFSHVDQLQEQPQSGSSPRELHGTSYRQIVEPPCRVIYRYAKQTNQIYILYVIRGEMLLRKSRVRAGDQQKIGL